nr:hypothetical protein [Tanacetum cinerariifolium]
MSLKWYPEEEHQPDDLLRSDEQRYRVIRCNINTDRKEAISPKWYPEEEHQPDDLLRSDEQRYRVIRLEGGGSISINLIKEGFFLEYTEAESRWTMIS